MQDGIRLRLVPVIGADPRSYAEFDVTAKLAGSFEEQASVLSTSTGGPWMTRNEARARQNLPAIDGGEESWYAGDVGEAYGRRKAAGDHLLVSPGGLAGRAVQRAMERADYALDFNMRRDPAHPRWAVVPHAGACGWCVMVASNGWAYSEESVSAQRHANCRCSVAVDFDRDNPVLDGYDPDKLYDAYSRAKEAVRDDAGRAWDGMSAGERAKYGSRSAYEARRIAEELDRRDRDWIQDTSKVPEVSWHPESLREAVIATRKHEYDTAMSLSLAGFHVDMREASGEWRSRTADSMISGESWEFKSPNGFGYLSVYNQLKSALYGNDNRTMNPQSDKVVISNVRSPMTMEDMIKGLDVALDGNRGLTAQERACLTEVLLVDRKGRTYRRTIN